MLVEWFVGGSYSWIDDQNIGGLEEAYLTGLFAANKIIAASRNG